ncbi:MAG: hypothetical protein NZ700_06420 [Gemmataceae bacterium]|nr:hypothetical protein [Gemmataceae bacterium]MDW8266158.1 hypothetical protein [Gemmataceae bacterium]
MKFNVAVVDPQGYPYTHFLYYFCKLLCYGLESLGHDCVISRNSLEPGRMTIIVGGHLLQSADQVDAIARAGPYIVLQTEVIKHGMIGEWNNQNQFRATYVPLLQRAYRVWEVIPHQVPLLAQIGVDAQLLLGGYHPALEEVRHKKEKDIDFLFFGSVTPHRREQLQRLQQRGHRLVVVFDEDLIFRNDLIARTKVNLCLRTSTALNHLPWGRICDLLNNRSLVVAEQCLEQDWLQHCFAWAPTESWVDLCEQTLLRPDREHVAAEYCERFRQMPFTDRLASVLEGI